MLMGRRRTKMRRWARRRDFVGWRPRLPELLVLPRRAITSPDAAARASDAADATAQPRAAALATAPWLLPA